MVPVRPAYASTLSFKHISLEPDFTLRESVPVYKLAALDALIDGLMKTGMQAARQTPSPRTIDRVVQDMSARLAQRTATPFGASARVGIGLLLNVAT